MNDRNIPTPRQIGDIYGAEPLKFAFWVPAFAGGFVSSTIEQRTRWDFDYNIRLAQIAEKAGFDYGLIATRWASTHGADSQIEATTLATALLGKTERLQIIVAVLTGLWLPGVIAKMGATADLFSNGRWNINVVSGWMRREYDAFGQPWIEHDERYARSEEFIEILKGIWTQDHYSFQGRHFSIDDYTLSPRPVKRPHPEIFQGGSSTAARRMAARWSDWYFTNGNTLDGIRAQIDEIEVNAAPFGRRPRVAVNAFVIARDTEKEARDVHAEIIRLADVKAVRGFQEATREAGQSTKDGKGNWTSTKLEDYVQHNDGFRTGLIGTPEQIAERIVAYKDIGVSAILAGFLHCHEDAEYFGRRILPLVRDIEAARTRAVA